MLSAIEDPASVREPLEGAGFVIVPRRFHAGTGLGADRGDPGLLGRPG